MLCFKPSSSKISQARLLCNFMYPGSQLLHRDTIRQFPAIFALHGRHTIVLTLRCAWCRQWQLRGNNMNKEYEPVWEQATAYRADDSAAPATKPSKAAAAGVKQIVTIRLDVDMLEWYKSAGPGYQTRINQILRDHMDAAKSH